ncbi:MAG: hypothetical protein JSV24_03030 [Bacteroidales bacterium]|nr:MAG: hypothetical protein JSV24_03030 [Bacteroidales bacterium]
MTKTLAYLLLFSALLLSNCRNHSGRVSSPAGINSSGLYEISPEIVIPYLPAQLYETSGLEIFNGLFWTMNDSGGNAAIFGFDPASGEIKQIVRITNAENNDWESLAADDQNIYIGDFGNNYGRRRDLTIYIIRKLDIPDAGNGSVEAGKIRFVYPDQNQFRFTIQHSSFDCEAFVCLNDSLYLFTKDWVNQHTGMYRVPAKPGEYVAELVDSFAADGLISGADINEKQDKLVLLGYKDYYPFIWVFSGVHGNRLFSHNNIRINLMDVYRAQTEAIVFSGEDTVFISAEESRVPSRLYRVILPPE